MTPLVQQTDAASYLPFVRKIARRLARRLPASVDENDLIGAGTVGLMEALDRYDPSGGRPFETYAEFRVKGAILDELRRQDPLNRSARAMQSKLAGTRASLTAELGRPPEDEELAESLGVSMDELKGKMMNLEACRIVPLINEEHISGDLIATREQEDYVHHQQKMAAVRSVIADLTKREQLVLNLYYVEDATQAQIGEILEVSESRVCQILSYARKKVRTRLHTAVPSASVSQ